MVQYKINAKKSNARCIFARDKSASTTTLPSALSYRFGADTSATPVNGPKEKYTTVPIDIFAKMSSQICSSRTYPSGQHILSWPVELVRLVDKWVRTDNTITRESARAYWLGRRARHSIQEDGRRLVWDCEDRVSENGKDANGSHAFSVIVSGGCWGKWPACLMPYFLYINSLGWRRLRGGMNIIKSINCLFMWHAFCLITSI